MKLSKSMIVLLVIQLILLIGGAIGYIAGGFIQPLGSYQHSALWNDFPHAPALISLSLLLAGLWGTLKSHYSGFLATIGFFVFSLLDQILILTVGNVLHWDGANREASVFNPIEAAVFIVLMVVFILVYRKKFGILKNVSKDKTTSRSWAVILNGIGIAIAIVGIGAAYVYGNDLVSSSYQVSAEQMTSRRADPFGLNKLEGRFRSQARNMELQRMKTTAQKNIAISLGVVGVGLLLGFLSNFTPEANFKGTKIVPGTPAEKHLEGSKTKSPSSGLYELEKLAELRDKGIITEDEFNAQKKKILDS